MPLMHTLNALNASQTSPGARASSGPTPGAPPPPCVPSTPPSSGAPCSTCSCRGCGCGGCGCACLGVAAVAARAWVWRLWPRVSWEWLLWWLRTSCWCWYCKHSCGAGTLLEPYAHREGGALHPAACDAPAACTPHAPSPMRAALSRARIVLCREGERAPCCARPTGQALRAAAPSPHAPPPSAHTHSRTLRGGARAEARRPGHHPDCDAGNGHRARCLCALTALTRGALPVRGVDCREMGRVLRPGGRAVVVTAARALARDALLRQEKEAAKHARGLVGGGWRWGKGGSW